MNLIPGEVTSEAGKLTFLAHATAIPVEPPPARLGPATLGVRCEHVHEEPNGPLVGRVLVEEYLGNATNVHVQTQVGRLVMRVAGGASRARGSEVRLRLDPRLIRVFDAATEDRL
jgi:sn-glycerol 3-phosphate transport system ATP-binding protein